MNVTGQPPGGHIFAVIALVALGCLVCACEADPKDWVISIADEHPPTQKTLLGVGLQTTLYVRLDCDFICRTDLPENLIVLPGDERDVKVDILDERPINDTHDAIEVRVTPLTAGKNRLRFVADNVDKKDTFAFEAREPTGGRIHYTVHDDPGSFSDPVVFVSSVMRLQPRFVVVNKPKGSEATVDTMLTGTSPLEIEGTPEEGTSLLGYLLSVADRPHDVKVATQVGLGELAIRVVDDTAIAKLSWSVTGTNKIDNAIWAREGAHFRVDIEPRTEDGKTILGRSPSIFSLQIEGDAVVEDARGAKHVWLIGRHSGKSSVKVSWGDGSLSIPITIASLPE